MPGITSFPRVVRDAVEQFGDLFICEPEGGYEARALGHGIFTEADTLEELKQQLRDAVRRHFDEDERPALVRLHLVREGVIAV
ncbi:MAG TPA: 2-oxoisovalerate dehydrogenase [Planctomycetaceae bacterium]|nr:2-oxoisovalerate dehydrogenase [Planctomycetaceae bacterium]HIQ20563.1 2-oxoisovalerate dehydrogenase [Planctomycetota bacterium]